MAFRVEISLQAKQDADAILDWLIEQYAGEAGLRWYQRLEAAIQSLANMPERCPLAPENAAVPFEMRQLLYGRGRHRYRILFTIDGNRVIILRIRRPGQQLLASH